MTRPNYEDSVACPLHHRAGYACEGCGYVKDRAFWRSSEPSDSGSDRG